LNLNVLEQAKQILLRDKEQNAYPLLLIKENLIDECQIYRDSVYLHDGVNGKYCYAADKFEEFCFLYDQVRHRNDGLVSLVTHDRFSDDIARWDKTLTITRTYMLQAISSHNEVPPPEGVQLAPVTSDLIDWILSVYDHPELSGDFIINRITEGPSVSAWSGERPVGFFLTHSAAELGPVYIDPGFRGSGLSEALYSAMIRQLSGHEKPVLFVYTENYRSLNWLIRMGCVQAKQHVIWFYREDY